MAPTIARSRFGQPQPLRRRRPDWGQQVGGLYMRMSSEARRAAFDVRKEQKSASLRSRSPLSNGRDVLADTTTPSLLTSQLDFSDESSNDNDDRCGGRRVRKATDIASEPRVATRRLSSASAVTDDASDSERLPTASPFDYGGDARDTRNAGFRGHRATLPPIADSLRKPKFPSWCGDWRCEQSSTLSRRQRQLLFESAADADGKAGGYDRRERSLPSLPAIAACRTSGGLPPQQRRTLQPLVGASAPLKRQPTVLFETTPRGYDSRYRAVALRALEGFRSSEEEQEQERLMGEIREAAVQKCLPWLRQAIAN